MTELEKIYARLDAFPEYLAYYIGWYAVEKMSGLERMRTFKSMGLLYFNSAMGYVLSFDDYLVRRGMGKLVTKKAPSNGQGFTRDED